MKTAPESVKKLNDVDQGFSKFHGFQILSKREMNCIRGGDGGEDVIIIPPPVKP